MFDVLLESRTNTGRLTRLLLSASPLLLRYYPLCGDRCRLLEVTPES